MMSTKKTICSTILYFQLIITLPYTVGSLSVRYDEVSIVSDKESLLTDDNLGTCVWFGYDPNASFPMRTKFRIRIPEQNVYAVNVSLTGTDMKCDDTFYVSPLSAAQTEKWTGRWITCTPTEWSLTGYTERCSFQCRCSGFCEEIQIVKMPSSASDSSWSLCEMSLTYKSD